MATDSVTEAPVGGGAVCVELEWSDAFAALRKHSRAAAINGVLMACKFIAFPEAAGAHAEWLSFSRKPEKCGTRRVFESKSLASRNRKRTFQYQLGRLPRISGPERLFA